MIIKNCAVAAILATTLVATMAITADTAFAYEENQAVSQVNDCGNGELPLNVFCSNTASQIQGEKNSAALTSEQTFREEVNEISPVASQQDLVEEDTTAPAGQQSINPLIVLPH